jgi:hypothetical protein
LRGSSFKTAVCLLILTVFLAGCVTQKRCAEKFPPARDTIKIVQTRDSIVYHHRDTVITTYLPGERKHDSIFINTPVPINSDTLRSDTPLATAEAWIANSFLMLNLTQKDTTILTRLQLALKEAYHWRSEYEKITEVPEPVKYVPKIYKYALWSLIFLTAFGVLWLYLRIKSGGFLKSIFRVKS